MKYLKIYEDFKQIEYWLVKTKSPEFEISLDKIGCTKSQKYFFLNKSKIFLNDMKWKRIYIPIGLSNPTIYSTHRKWFDDNGYIYRGGLKITSNEIEIWNGIKEYNL
jgi:hypothetical protein